jgi:hypothetical protein
MAVVANRGGGLTMLTVFEVKKEIPDNVPFRTTKMEILAK